MKLSRILGGFLIGVVVFGVVSALVWPVLLGVLGGLGVPHTASLLRFAPLAGVISAVYSGARFA